MMSKAEYFFNRFEALDKAISLEAVETEIETIDGVQYTTHTFADDSKFKTGSNGYMGFETLDTEGA